MTKKYDTHRREYTILGITAVIEAMVSDITHKVYQGTFPELFSLVVDGVYYHSLPVTGREQASRLVVKSFQEKSIDLSAMYEIFDAEVTKYEQLIDLPEEQFSLQTILDFFSFYKELFPTAYVGMDPIDFTDTLSPQEKEEFFDWATKIRHRGEVIYKRGEMEFIPRYLAWFAKHHASLYRVDHLLYLVCTEMENFVQKNAPLPTPEELEQRKKVLYVHQYPPGKIEFYFGEQAQKMIDQKEFFKKEVDHTVNEVKGQVGYRGIVTGKVCIVTSRADMNKFQDGDIIVSEMTDPSYLPIMKRALAFVTDEGGMLCHAAIVARELQKPCVIGTKHATKVFHDGDMIEVNAEQGTVKKI